MSGQAVHNAPLSSTDSRTSQSSDNADTAVKGAAKAFGKPKPPPKPDLARINPHNGAFIAANSSWASRSTSDLPSARKLVQEQKPTLPKRPSSPIIQQSKSNMAEAFKPRVQSVPPALPKRPSSIAIDNPSLVVKAVSRPPLPPPPRRSNTVAKQDDTKFASSAAILASRSPPKSDILPPPHIPSPRRSAHYKDRSAQMLEPHFTDHTLADAIVGANLAVSRNPSPNPLQNSGISDYHKAFESPRQNNSRNSSPKKNGGGMRQTLRMEQAPIGVEEGRGRAVLGVRRHPHKHHEGERKRWREVVTEDEYKRYAGLWASNRGLLFSQREKTSTEDNLEEEVCNVATRELWRRSRLPDSILHQIWELVNERKVPRLTKEQFVVGMWLIDQQLMGRKVPNKVLPSVWQSVERLSGPGVKIRLT